MEKRIVIAGCRDYNNYSEAKDFIDSCLTNIRTQHTLIIVSGGCSGADMLGEKYANENGFKIERHNANWSEFGRSAGPIRNKKMATISDYVICFWDGKSKGTKSMIEFAKQLEKPIRVKMI